MIGSDEVVKAWTAARTSAPPSEVPEDEAERAKHAAAVLRPWALLWLAMQIANLIGCDMPGIGAQVGSAPRGRGDDRVAAVRSAGAERGRNEAQLPGQPSMALLTACSTSSSDTC